MRGACVPFDEMSEAFHIRLLCLNVPSIVPMSPCLAKQPATPPGDQRLDLSEEPHEENIEICARGASSMTVTVY